MFDLCNYFYIKKLGKNFTGTKPQVVPQTTVILFPEI